ncbi:MAG: sulfotransferase [Flavobacteriales bacterium]|nr:sulfotransferase [Flavobacteriales bacterium]
MTTTTGLRSLERRFIFVIGSPRSGTSWLHRMIAAHSSVASIEGELTVFSRYVAPLVKGYESERGHLERNEWHQGLPLLFTPAEFDESVRNLIGHVYDRLMGRRPEATHLLDKHPGYSHHLDLIERFVPRARFVHIVRDGREVAVSMISAKRRLGFGAGEVEGAAREWHACTTKARAFGERIGARYLEVRYEDLQRDTSGMLASVFKHCELACEAQEVDRIAEEFHISRTQVSRGDTSLNDLRHVPDAIWRVNLTTRQRYVFDRVAGDLLCDLGYARRGWWILGAMEPPAMLLYPLWLKLRRTLRALSGIWSHPAIPRAK